MCDGYGCQSLIYSSEYILIAYDRSPDQYQSVHNILFGYIIFLINIIDNKIYVKYITVP